jgi:alanine racemase
MKFRQGRPTVAEIDRAALRSNFAQVKTCVKGDVAICAIVKADGYGHGGPEVARVLEREGVRSFGVATVEEGVAIRELGVVHPDILVFGGFVADQVEPLFHHRLTPVVSDLELAKMLDGRMRGAMRSLPVHIKADTGLGRLGPPLAALPAFLEAMKKFDRLKIAGLCSHLGSAVKLSGPAMEQQFTAFVRAGELCAIHGSPVKIRHVANSVATLMRPDLHFEMVRPGIVLYGIFPGAATEGPIEIKPAMKLKTQVLQVRRLPPGYGVSYDQTFITQRETLVATLPIGYADGYPRSLSNKGEVLVRERRAPILGRVCMDLTVVDVTDVPGVERGDEVVLWGRQGDAEIRVDEVADWAGTISYEILTTVGRRIPRVYVN